jgi:hypothetical protein
MAGIILSILGSIKGRTLISIIFIKSINVLTLLFSEWQHII